MPIPMPSVGEGSKQALPTSGAQVDQHLTFKVLLDDFVVKLNAQHQRELFDYEMRFNSCMQHKVEARGVQVELGCESETQKQDSSCATAAEHESNEKQKTLQKGPASVLARHSLQHQVAERIDHQEEAAARGEDLKEAVDGSADSCLSRLQAFLFSDRFEGFIAVLLLTNLLVMAAEVQFIGTRVGTDIGFYNSSATEPKADIGILTFDTMDAIFTILFTIDVVVRASVLGVKFWYAVLNWIDFTAVVASYVELALQGDFAIDPMLFRLLRMGQLARVLRMRHLLKWRMLESLTLLVKCLVSSHDILFWSFCLLVLMQCIAGMVVSTFTRHFLEDKNNDLQLRKEVFLFYGTFTRAFLTMFEVMFANWAPACRILTDNISELFSVFFLIYRCVIGFAVLNVLNAVFVQQTLKVAHSDEDIAFLMKEREHNKYTSRLKAIFKEVDISGDGHVTIGEFERMLEKPKLKFWLTQLDLEYYDLLALFELLDDGDGQISLDEFMEGALRLRGHSKSLDIWRLERKLEVLLKKIMEFQPGHSEERHAVSGMLKEAGWHHQVSATDVRQLR
eukprot:TRINITY_DN28767_c0_g1_i1.p1 TRINITY_DN28767_c0_g1~~TRINITY_DN28767_c0_g1_i1.p1  ORF type:complete len:581 (-),score=108.82 TRINITY_DN28767_c0_g1_i1:118-1809(-)